MDQLLKEYLLSRELDEAARCIRELNCPHFHHELVKRGVTAAMEEVHDKSDSGCVIDDLDAVAALYAFLVENSIISESQVRKGVKRLNDLIDDLKLDITPKAPTLLSEFQQLLTTHGLEL
jgi:programmed cell death protein 4